MEQGKVNSDDGVQFARDLRRIREAMGLKIPELSDATRIPEGVLRSFEKNALFDHPVFNVVYLRSFVKTYATAIGISADDAIDGLEQSLAGMYRGAIGRDFFGEVQRADSEAEVDDTGDESNSGDHAESVGVTATPPTRPEPVTISSTPVPETQPPIFPSAPPGMVVRPSIVRRVFTVVTTIGILILVVLIVRTLFA